MPLVQAITGWQPRRHEHAADRLSGVFGADNLKLGLVLASLSPFALDAMARRFGRLGWLLAALVARHRWSCWPARVRPG